MKGFIKTIVMVVPLGIAVIALALSVWLLTAGPAQAATCDVPTGTHSTIQSAVDDAGCDTINLTAALYVENISVTHSINIQGQGSLSTTVDGDANGSVFTIQPGLVVTLTDMTITNGEAMRGGGIYNNGSVLYLDTIMIISNTSASHYRSDGGGGVYNESGELTINNSIISGNQVNIGDHGGGIYNDQDGLISIMGSIISDNLADCPFCDGGGIYSNSGILSISHSEIFGNSSHDYGGGVFSTGTMTVTNSSISGNSAGNGGGIFGDIVTVINSTISSNSAGHRGGGIDSGSLMIINSTISDNSANIISGCGCGGGINIRDDEDLTLTNSTISGNFASGAGSGIFIDRGNGNIANSTISGNHANGDGGGIFIDYGSSYIANSTITGNTARRGSGIVTGNNSSVLNSIIAGNMTFSIYGFECHLSVTSLGYNLFGDDSCSPTGIGDIISTNPNLGPLQDNGGDTLTHRLLPGSRAIDTGNPATPGSGNGACEETDQRGLTRVRRCDIGAYEYQGEVYSIFLPMSAKPSICNVPSISYPTIQSAIDDDGCKTVNLTSALYKENVVIDRGVKVQGQGAVATMIDGSASGSVFAIQSIHPVTLTKLAITNGDALAGGGIYHNGQVLVLDTVNLFGNMATGPGVYEGGGAIVNLNGVVQINQSNISNNLSCFNGGAIYNRDTVILTDSTLDGNRAGCNGEGTGGGIDNRGTVTIINSTLSGNSATSTDVAAGGAIHNWFGTVNIWNSTLSGNSSADGGVGNYGMLTVENSTVVNNIGGGIWSDGSLFLSSSIVANNPNGHDCTGSSGNITSWGYNLDSDNSCNLTTAGDIRDKNPRLGPLQDNGGHTLTHALQSNSPAIDQIPPGGNGCGTAVSFDQRGVTRPQGPACDIGAFEVNQ